MERRAVDNGGGQRRRSHVGRPVPRSPAVSCSALSCLSAACGSRRLPRRNGACREAGSLLRLCRAGRTVVRCAKAAGTVCDEITSTIDLLPTFARLAGASAPADRKIDRGDIAPLLRGAKGAASPHKAFFCKGQSVREGKWKRLRLQKTTELYDLGADIGEKNNTADEHPDVVKHLEELLRAHLEDLEKNSRPRAKVPGAKPIIPKSNDAQEPADERKKAREEE